MHVQRLVDFPYVLVRLRCDTCKRAGSAGLARLAVKYGAETPWGLWSAFHGHAAATTS
jgi:hypothetical protein